jgi:HlyD family secretion protein
LISTSPFEIEVNIPEADIAKVNIGNEAKVTLDAYGSETIFKAKVVSIDPGETVLEGVATYRTILHFLEDDKRIRPGLTANVEILTDKRENVIAIPWRAIMTKDGEKFVRVLEGNEVKEVKVKTGLQGSDGNVEIIEGIREGDKVIVD